MSTPTRKPPARAGWTLIELMISLAIFMVVLAAVFGALSSSQRTYARQAQTSSTHDSLRSAALRIEAELTMAGYGIDPNYAIETYNTATNTPWDGQGPNGSDVLVTQRRDPAFRRNVITAASSSLILSSPLLEGEEIYVGQRLLVLCDGATDYAYLMASQKSAAGSTTVTLSTTAAAPYNNNSKLSGTCFSSGRAILTRIERRAFFIGWISDPMGSTPRPALLVNKGVDSDENSTAGQMPTSPNWPSTAGATGLGDSEVVALDIEQLQVAYVMNRPSPALATLYGIAAGPDTDGNFVYGDQPNVAEAPNSTNPTYTGATPLPTPASPPLLNDPGCGSLAMDTNSNCGYGGKRRYSGHPGNIRAVRFTLEARSMHEDPGLAPTTPLTAGAMENLTVALPSTKHARDRFAETISLRNMFQRKHFVPAWGYGG